VRVSKPVATGGVLVSPDTRLLSEAADCPDWPAITPWVFPEPAAPPVAARLQGTRLRLDDIAAAVRNQVRPASALLVEGVGGLLCPLTDTETVADLCLELGLPLIIVTRRSLGTLNHTLLTVEVARRHGLSIAGVVVNETEPVRSLAEKTNVEQLRQRLVEPILAVVPHGNVAGALGEIDWWRLCGGE
jgi:dethiobiotin synthetase